jgi:hypothetical protein
MSVRQTSIASATRSSSLADILERVLDKGVVIAGDIKIKLVEIELLTIQIRLVVCSVERAMEMGMDWWRTDPNWSALARQAAVLSDGLASGALATASGASGASGSIPGALPQAVGAVSPAEAPAAVLEGMEQRMRDMEATLRRLEEKLTPKP